jgi:hypothetical protein
MGSPLMGNKTISRKDNNFSYEIIRFNSNANLKISKLLVICCAISLVQIVNSPNFGYAQDSNNQGEGSPKLLASTETSISSTNQSPIAPKNSSMRYLSYMVWLDTAVRPLANEAKEKGIIVSKEEISIQAKAFKVMFPDIPAREEELINEVLAKKYSQSIMGTSASIDDKKKAYQEIKSDFSEGTVPPEAQIEAFLETRALVGRPAVKQLAMQLNGNDRIEYQRAFNNREMWSADEMRFKSSGEICIARHPDSSGCLLTVKKYNNIVKYQFFPKIMPLDTSRKMAIRAMLSDRYALDEARKKGFTKSDTAEQETKSWLEWFAHNAKLKGTGRPVTDPNILAATYNRYCNTFFSERRKPFYSIIGSNDSSYVYSISHIAVKVDKKNRQKDSLSSDTVYEPELPWTHSCAVPLPDDFMPQIDTLPVGGISRVIRTSYGYFVVRFDSMQVIPRISFEEAHDKLIVLATKQKWLNLDSVIQAKAYKIYTANKKMNTAPDTFTLVSFLSPGWPQDSSVVEGKKGRSSKKRPHKKSLSSPLTKGIIISSIRLPFDLLDSLDTRYTAANKDKRNGTFGPIRSRYGTWHFKVLGVKTAETKLPFSYVGKLLIDSLIVNEIDSGDCIWFERPDSETTEMALAKAYKGRFFGLESIGKANASREGNADNNSRGNNSDAGSAIKTYETRLSEVESWIDKIVIKMP